MVASIEIPQGLGLFLDGHSRVELRRHRRHRLLLHCKFIGFFMQIVIYLLDTFEIFARLDFQVIGGGTHLQRIRGEGNSAS